MYGNLFSHYEQNFDQLSVRFRTIPPGRFRMGPEHWKKNTTEIPQWRYPRRSSCIGEPVSFRAEIWIFFLSWNMQRDYGWFFNNGEWHIANDWDSPLIELFFLVNIWFFSRCGIEIFRCNNVVDRHTFFHSKVRYNDEWLLTQDRCVLHKTVRRACSAEMRLDSNQFAHDLVIANEYRLYN